MMTRHEQAAHRLMSVWQTLNWSQGMTTSRVRQLSGISGRSTVDALQILQAQGWAKDISPETTNHRSWVRTKSGFDRQAAMELTV